MDWGSLGAWLMDRLRGGAGADPRLSYAEALERYDPIQGVMPLAPGALTFPLKGIPGELRKTQANLMARQPGLQHIEQVNRAGGAIPLTGALPTQSDLNIGGSFQSLNPQVEKAQLFNMLMRALGNVSRQ